MHDMSNVAIAFLQRPDGQMRMVCVGCSEILYEQGMLKLMIEEPLPVVGSADATQVFYKIAEPFTVEECREAIKARHTGTPWGE
jgi:hypothetical protein